MNLGLGLGTNKIGGNRNRFNQYALTYNGTDEYLTRALPVNLLTGNANDWSSAGTLPTGWTADGVDFDSTETGKTGTYAVYIPVGQAVTIPGFTVGRKYKIKIRYKGGGTSFNISNGAQLFDKIVSTTWNTIYFTFTATATTLIFASDSDWFLDVLSFIPDWKTDLNEQYELIKHSDDREFGDTSISYTDNGNHSGVRSTADFRVTPASFKITATGAGDTTTNFIGLPYTSFETLVSGNKYTKELFAKTDASSLAYGTDLFSSIQHSTTYPYETFSASGNAITSAINTTGVASAFINIGNVVSGQIVKVTFNLTLNSGAVPRVLLMESGESIAGTNANSQNPVAGVNTLYFTVINTQSPTYLVFRDPSTTATNYSIADIVVVKSTPITIIAVLGSKSVVITPSISAYSKLVLNFECGATEINQDIKWYLSGAGSCYVDSVSLTQAYDFVRDYLINPAVSEKRAIYSLGTANFAETKANGYVKATGSDGTNTVTNESLTQYSASSYQRFVQTLNRTDKLYLTKNGTSDAGVSAVLLGKTIHASKLNIGANGSDLERFSGQIGAVVFIRFTKIEASNYVKETYIAGQPISGGGAEVVMWIDPRLGSSVTAMLQDYSGNGNALTAVNIDTTNRVRI